MAEARGGGWGWWVLKYKSGMCHGWFKNRKTGGLGNGPLLKMGAGSFQNWPTREKKKVLELKITKKHIYFFNMRIFSSYTGRKSGVLWSCQGGGGGGLSGGTYQYCPNMGVSPTPTPHPPRPPAEVT